MITQRKVILFIVRIVVGTMTAKSSALPAMSREFVWTNIILICIVHILALLGLYHAVFTAKWLTLFYGYLAIYISGLGITAGAHRLWTHRTYKARLPLRILLAIMHTSVMQTPIYEWVRDHRVHHKYSDTDADPHNASRGIFFSHVGWLMVRKHPDVITKGKTIDLSDLTNDKVVMMQYKLHNFLSPPLALVLPCLIPWLLWDESLWVSWLITGWLRYCLVLNGTWAVNSFAHFYGMKPYDKKILPSENRYVAMAAFGEGWHNYHHVFPWDYKTAELGSYGLNWTTAFIDFMAWIGWAYDRKSATPNMIKDRILRTGIEGSTNDKTDENCDGEY